MSNWEESKRYPDNLKRSVSCPGCGQEYGHHNTKVCTICEECSKCCTCAKDSKLLIPAAVFVEQLNS